MNIFYVDEDPKIAATLLCDKHVVRMILESAQMLSTAHRILDGVEVQTQSPSSRKKSVWMLEDASMDNILYNATHMNHPSNVWVRESAYHYAWLYKHFIALCDEYTKRYEKTHKTDATLRRLLVDVPDNIKLKEFSPPPQAMPDEYKQNDTVEAYRAYYRAKFHEIDMRWKKTAKPEFMGWHFPPQSLY